MTDQELTKEERILRVMKRVLTDVAKDTYTRPGHRHPLSDETVDGIRYRAAEIAEDEVSKEWWKLTDPCQEPVESAGEGVWWADMEEVYHLD